MHWWYLENKIKHEEQIASFDKELEQRFNFLFLKTVWFQNALWTRNSQIDWMRVVKNICLRSLPIKSLLKRQIWNENDVPKRNMYCSRVTRYLWLMILCRVGWEFAHCCWKFEWLATFVWHICRTFKVYCPFKEDKAAIWMALGCKEQACIIV